MTHADLPFALASSEFDSKPISAMFHSAVRIPLRSTCLKRSELEVVKTQAKEIDTALTK